MSPDTSDEATTTLLGLTETELSGLLAVCVVVGTAAWTTPDALPTRLVTLVLAVAGAGTVYVLVTRRRRRS